MLIILSLLLTGAVNGMQISFDLCCGNVSVLTPDSFESLWKSVAKLENVERLNLEKNINITYLNASVFSNFENLQILELWKTKLSDIDKNAFQGLNSLTKLFLNENRLTQIKPGTFNGLENLRVLDLSFNNLWSIDSNLVANLSKLELISINDNPSLLKNSLVEVKGLCKSTRNPKCKLYY